MHEKVSVLKLFYNLVESGRMRDLTNFFEMVYSVFQF